VLPNSIIKLDERTLHFFFNLVTSICDAFGTGKFFSIFILKTGCANGLHKDTFCFSGRNARDQLE